MGRDAQLGGSAVAVGVPQEKVRLETPQQVGLLEGLHVGDIDDVILCT